MAKPEPEPDPQPHPQSTQDQHKATWQSDAEKEIT